MDDRLALEHMQRAITLAQQGRGRVSPNPPVGCVIAKGEAVVGEGWHETFGGPHAEVQALAAAGDEAKGATACVTLAPCDHHGKTPPCTQALIKSGVREVIAAHHDPRPGAGEGMKVLAKAGLETHVGLLARDAAWIMRGYLKHLATGLPALTLKYAMTLDGHIATTTGDSKWISCEASREEVQKLRTAADAVLVGIGTALQDDPRLNVRDTSAHQPLRVIVDSKAQLSPQARLFREPGGPVLILTTEAASAAAREALGQAGADLIVVPATEAGRVDLTSGLEALAERGVREVLCEGGGRLAGGLMDAALVDEIIAFVSPKLVGSRDAPVPLAGVGHEQMTDALTLQDVTWEAVDKDLLVKGRLGNPAWLPAP